MDGLETTAAAAGSAIPTVSDPPLLIPQGTVLAGETNGKTSELEGLGVSEGGGTWGVMMEVENSTDRVPMAPPPSVERLVVEALQDELLAEFMEGMEMEGPSEREGGAGLMAPPQGNQEQDAPEAAKGLGHTQGD